MLERIQWLGRSSFSLQGPPLIYIDPTGITRNAFLADVILVSQATYEHCSPLDIRKLVGPNTLIVGNEDVAQMLEGHVVQTLRPWQSLTVGKARITAVPGAIPALRNGGERASLGFLISLDYYDLYYAGSVLSLPEDIQIRPDIAILPVRHTHTGLMSIDTAVEVVRKLRPRWVIPSHWNPSNGGGYLDVKAFQAALAGLAEVVIPRAAQTAAV